MRDVPVGGEPVELPGVASERLWVERVGQLRAQILAPGENGAVAVQDLPPEDVGQRLPRAEDPRGARAYCDLPARLYEPGLPCELHSRVLVCSAPAAHDVEVAQGLEFVVTAPTGEAERGERMRGGFSSPHRAGAYRPGKPASSSGFVLRSWGTSSRQPSASLGATQHGCHRGR